MAFGVPLLQVFVSELEQLKAIKTVRESADTEGVYWENIFFETNIKYYFLMSNKLIRRKLYCVMFCLKIGQPSRNCPI